MISDAHVYSWKFETEDDINDINICVGAEDCRRIIDILLNEKYITIKLRKIPPNSPHHQDDINDIITDKKFVYKTLSINFLPKFESQVIQIYTEDRHLSIEVPVNLIQPFIFYLIRSAGPTGVTGGEALLCTLDCLHDINVTQKDDSMKISSLDENNVLLNGDLIFWCFSGEGIVYY